VNGFDNTTGCYAFDIYSVSVYPLPSATLTTSANGVCAGGSAITINSGLSAGSFSSASIPHAPLTAPATATTLVANQTASVAGADSRALGGGLQNTLDIAAQAGNVAATCAAVYCNNLVSGGQSDWYLPSIAELKMVNDVVYLQLGGGGLDYQSYWSSTEFGAIFSWIQDFARGAQDNLNKNSTLYVRPVRRF
jgi:hypothetical protein